MAYASVTVTDSATLIVGANTKRQELTIVNTSETVNVFTGPDSSITTSNAIPLYAMQRNDRWKGPGGSWLGPIYAICPTGQTADVRYWEVER